MPIVSSAFLRASLRACCAALRARAACEALVTITLPSVGLRSNQSASQSLQHLLHERLGLGVAELGLGLALELRLAQLDRDDRRQALADVVAGEPSSSLSLMIFLSIAHRLTTLVSAARNPSSWVPPSMVLIVLAKV